MGFVTSYAAHRIASGQAADKSDRLAREHQERTWLIEERAAVSGRSMREESAALKREENVNAAKGFGHFIAFCTFSGTLLWLLGPDMMGVMEEPGFVFIVVTLGMYMAAFAWIKHLIAKQSQEAADGTSTSTSGAQLNPPHDAPYHSGAHEADPSSGHEDSGAVLSSQVDAESDLLEINSRARINAIERERDSLQRNERTGPPLLISGLPA